MIDRVKCNNCQYLFSLPTLDLWCCIKRRKYKNIELNYLAIHQNRKCKDFKDKNIPIKIEGYNKNV